MDEIAHSFPFKEGWPNSISEPADSFLRAWLKIRNGRILPKRTDIEPVYFIKLLPMVWLYEYLPDEKDYICHLHGETIREAWGFSLRGKKLSEFAPPDYVEKMKNQWARVRQEPALLHSILSHPTDYSRAAERLCMPVTDDDGIPNFVLGLTLYADIQGDPTSSLEPRGEILQYFTIRKDSV